MTEYPRDQFDDVPEYRDRKGSHRAVAEPSGGSGPSGLTWISLAAALALVIGAFSYFILPTLLPSGAAGPGTAGASPSATAPGSPSPGRGSSSEAGAGTADPSGPGVATASVEPTAAPAESPESTETPEPTESPEPSQTPEPTESPEETEEPATVDYSFPVEVYNTSRVNGLAGRVGGTLSGSGFTVATAGNWSGFPVSSSAVFYSSNEVTAQAVAARLGLPAVYDGRIPGIAVVVTAAYAG